MTTATATTTVHKTIPGFTALFEGAVDWRACGPVGVEVADASLSGRVPDVARAKAIWNKLMATGHVAKDKNGNITSCYLSDLHWYLTTELGYSVDWIDYRATPDLNAIHAMIKAAALVNEPCVLLLTNGQALPDNEQKVFGHFTASGGIDSQAGYLIANGDTQTAIRTRVTHPPLNWATWATLANAQVCGIIRVHAKPAPPPPPPTPQPAPDYQAEIDALKAQVTALSTTVTQVQTHVATIEDGLKTA